MIFNPLPYQKTAIEFVKTHPNAALLLDCGLGKTAITLTAIKDMGLKNVLVIAPRLVVNEWIQEINKWDHLKNISAIAVEPDKKSQTRKDYVPQKMKAPANIHIISRDHVDYLKQSGIVDLNSYDMIVMDESTSFKNYSAARTKALFGLTHPRKVILTGTPMPRDVEDLFAQYKILDGGIRLERTVTAFREKYMQLYDPKRYLYRPQPNAIDRVFDRIEDITISMRSEEHIKLPPFQSVRKTIQLDEDTMKLYKKLKREYCLELGDSIIKAKNSGILTNKLSQLTNGFIYDTKGNVRYIHDKKLDALQSILEVTAGMDGNSEDVVVAYNYQEDLRRIEELLKRMGLESIRLDSAANIEKFKAGFDMGYGRVALLQPKSDMYGLNLQNHCRRLVWYSLPWSYDEFKQTVKRIYRLGQERRTIMHSILVEGTIDDRLIEVVNFKMANNDKLIELTKAIVEEEKQAYLAERETA